MPQIIDTLQMYQKEMSDPNSEIGKNYLSKEKQQSVIEIYLKEIEVTDEKASNKENWIRLSRRKYWDMTSPETTLQ